MATPDPVWSDIMVKDLVFATKSTVEESVRYSRTKTESYTIADRLEKIDKVVTITRLRPDNINSWAKTLRQLITVTSTAAAFLSPDDQSTCGESALALWSNYWITKLKDAAPSDYKFNTELPPIDILIDMVTKLSNRSASRVNQIAADFWGIRAKSDQTLTSFLKLLDTRLTLYRQHFTLKQEESETAFKALLSYIFSILRPELALKCDDFSSSDMIAELRKWAGHEVLAVKPALRSQSSNPATSSKTCNFCKAKGHLESECRKKAGVKCVKCGLLGHTEAMCKKQGTIAAASDVLEGSFQLDTATDQNTTGNKEIFSSYVPCNRSIRLANASTGRILGTGTITVPSLSTTPVELPAIHLEGCTTTLLSLSKLEAAGYHLHIPEDIKEDLQLRSPSREIILTFCRQGPRYIWEPPKVPSPWHAALGHINNAFLANTLRQQGIEPPPPTPCVPCAKAKFTRRPGSGSLINATAKLQTLHLDLVGGKNSLPSSVSLSDIPAATYCLLIIDEYTRYKWQIPVYAKDDCPQLLKAFLQQLHTEFGRFPARLHSDRGSEFINGKIQDFLTLNGIIWTGSAAYAHEQNGLVERTVRTVFEALRATHIHANIPAKLWPITASAVVRILNSTASSRVSTSPYFELFGRQPSLDKYPLGCRVLYQLDDKKPRKLQSRTEDGIYLGTDHHITTIYCLKSKRVVTRRDFTAFPDQFPLLPTVSAISTDSDEITPSKALSGPQRELWYQAMSKEAKQMLDRKVWDLVPKSTATTRPMTGTWVLKAKSDGTFKARWCARGFAEPNLKDIYADVLHAVTVRMLFAYAASHQFEIQHIDITAAFLNADLDQDLYIEQPRHLPHIPGMVCKLNKAIYGLRSAPNRWQKALREKLISLNFEQLTCDPNVFRREDLLISTYVDDFKVIGPTAKAEAFIIELERIYQLRRLGLISSYLGMEITKLPSVDGFSFALSQQTKIEKLITDLNISRPADTPVADDNAIDHDTDDPATEPELYRSAVGQLLHISLLTRPDIAYAVLRLTQRVSRPSKRGFKALLQCVRYLAATKHLALLFKPGKSTILASSDSSWGTATQSKATTGNVFLLNGSQIAWAAKRQSLTAQSTCEAEYIAASSLATTARWILPLFNEIWQRDHGPITVQMDNQSAIATAVSGGLNSRNRHYLIRNAVLC